MNSNRTPNLPAILDPQGHPPLSRRTFLARSAGLVTLGAAAPHLVPRHVLGAGEQPPSETLTLAAVGIGGMGQHYLDGCKGARVVALCDADHNLAGKVFEKYPGAARYHDFRKMFDTEAKNFDALIIGTPDHTHAVILMAALQLGKHVYCAKPVTHTIGEARKVRQASWPPHDWSPKQAPSRPAPRAPGAPPNCSTPA